MKKTGKWTRRAPKIPEDVDRMREIIQQHNIRYVLIDPLMAYLSGKVSAHNDQDVRGALAPLAAMADETGAAILVLRHLNKLQGAAALYRGGGSIGIIGAARSALLVARHPDEDGKFILARNKCNLSRFCESLCYSLEEVEGTDVARVKWEGVVSYTADDLLTPPKKNKQPTETEQKAIDFYMSVLGDGEEHLSTEVDKQREMAGISERTAKRVRKQMGVKARREGTGKDSKWYISLPNSNHEKDDAEEDSPECQPDGTSDPLGTQGTQGTQESKKNAQNRPDEAESANSANSAKNSNGSDPSALYENDPLADDEGEEVI